jgi:hypothetical protein
MALLVSFPAPVGSTDLGSEVLRNAVNAQQRLVFWGLVFIPHFISLICCWPTIRQTLTWAFTPLLPSLLEPSLDSFELGFGWRSDSSVRLRCFESPFDSPHLNSTWSIYGLRFVVVTLEACILTVRRLLLSALSVWSTRDRLYYPSPWWRFLSEHQSYFVGIGWGKEALGDSPPFVGSSTET